MPTSNHVILFSCNEKHNRKRKLIGLSSGKYCKQKSYLFDLYLPDLLLIDPLLSCAIMAFLNGTKGIIYLSGILLHEVCL